jgi:hypothetical protein
MSLADSKLTTVMYDDSTFIIFSVTMMSFFDDSVHSVLYTLTLNYLHCYYVLYGVYIVFYTCDNIHI